MQSRPRDLLTRKWRSEANPAFFLFLLIITVFVLPSLGVGRNHLQLYADLALSVTLIFGIGLAWEFRELFVVTLIVSIAAIVLQWVAWWTPTHSLVLVSEALALAAIFAVIAVLLRQIFRSGPVTAIRVQGSIAVYLGMALAWAHADHITALLLPGSFNAGSLLSHPNSWVNFSFGMLTTLGYDGIAPVSPVAHSLCSSEAVTGQLYLAVLVARLVSMQVSASQQGADETSNPGSSG